MPKEYKFTYRKKKSPWRFLKYILLILLVAGLSVVVFNSNLPDALGFREDPLPSEYRVNHLDDRIISYTESGDEQEGFQAILSNIIGIFRSEDKHGSLTIIARDASFDYALPNFEFDVYNIIEDEFIATIKTDNSGEAIIERLPKNAAYRITPKNAHEHFKPYGESINFAMDADKIHVNFEFEVLDHIKRYNIASNGQLEIIETFINVPMIYQNPELPNGCEIVSMTAALNYFGYQADKVDMAANYLPRNFFYRVEGELHGPHPNKAYAGEPESPTNGFYVYAPPAVKAANDFISDVAGNHQAIDLTGSAKAEIMEYVYMGKPVVIWATLDLSPGRINYGWWLNDGSGVYYEAFVNLHCMVIHGVNEDMLYVMDPLEGFMEYPLEEFFESYQSLGSRAITLVELDN